MEWIFSANVNVTYCCNWQRVPTRPDLPLPRISSSWELMGNPLKAFSIGSDMFAIEELSTSCCSAPWESDVVLQLQMLS